ncbi:conjugal transfer protein TraF [Thaumasiovibrio subtropicus]|uniref:conjugal transfer protein TraF n=1 Tax=Thaumasiovibrio subtropicus TaxID=1891207 RepID=UPI000B3620CE|nr:conjugal transfer protein TraF [Thaumasiovibrio subtropicus]
MVATGTLADARGVGMGRVGVASGDYLSASMYNPALAANYDRDRDNFGMLFPSVRVSAHDGDDLYNKTDHFIEISDQIDDVLSAGGEVSAELSDNWQQALRELDNSKGMVDAAVGMVIAIPNRYLSVSFFTQAEMATVATANVDARDYDIDFNQPCKEPRSYCDVTSRMHSTVQGVGAAVGDVGFTFATDYLLQVGEQDYRVNLGISPKYQHLMAINYHTKAADFDDDEFEFGDEYTEKGAFNVDVGMTIQPTAQTTVGFVARNLIKQSLQTNFSQVGSVDVMVVEPTYVVGASYQNAWLTTALDIDLNSKRYFKGMDYKTQFTRLGVEVDAWRWAQLRLGYQHSMTSNADDVYSLGLGFTPFGRFGLDVSAEYSGDNRYGAAAQFIFTL